MAFCNFCSEEIPDNSLDCPNCQIPIQAARIPKEVVFICPVCGAENPPGERKCNDCCSLF